MSETKTSGWFSRRYQTAERHLRAKENKAARVNLWLETMQNNEIARKSRTHKEQLALLDERLGIGIGAKKERARLALLIHNKESREKKKNG